MVIPRRARCGRKRRVLGKAGHIVLCVFHGVDRLERGAERGLQRTTERNAGGVTQQLIDGDDMARIIRILPGGDWRRPVELQLALAHEDARQRRHHRLRHGEAEQLRLRPDTISIALGNDAPGLHDDDRAGAAIRRLRGFGESAVERG
ncbi:hypothetical protein ACVWZZ_003911 [Bradyrhizobium sp. LM6.10]